MKIKNNKGGNFKLLYTVRSSYKGKSSGESRCGVALMKKGGKI